MRAPGLLRFNLGRKASPRPGSRQDIPSSEEDQTGSVQNPVGRLFRRIVRKET